ncbi:hypothetical protein H8S90_21320 [Olivibacter sp. SDN3]|uniref:hypothetical protein n=1 Tax=Olivibacter sp. SDN3 TaxID=2764720 RepID=UPI0016518E68|nr:hypothetical protein [Olivibacter sp. SDN3]QNL49253.1 hypothetical protein H8S90_21320 [Olivibacter sp. SDN3]
MERKGTITIDFDGRLIFIEYTLFFYADSYYIDLPDKNGVRHRFRRTGDTWKYCSLKRLKWPKLFVEIAYRKMDEALLEYTDHIRL